MSGRVHVERSGGFAGVTRRGSVGLDALSDEETALLRDVLGEDAAGAGAPRGADRFQYHLVVEDDDGRRERTVPEAALPEGLRPLVRRALDDAS